MILECIFNVRHDDIGCLDKLVGRSNRLGRGKELHHNHLENVCIDLMKAHRERPSIMTRLISIDER